MSDMIDRQAAIDALAKFVPYAIYDESTESYTNGLTDAYNLICQLPSAQPDNQIHLCDSCEYNYPECPCKQNDVIFGNGKGNDNICACNKYKPSAQPEQRWIPVTKRLPEDEYVLISKKPSKITGSKWSVDIAIRTADPRSGKIQWRDSGFGVIQDDKVLAWMPRPKPYREEGEQKWKG